MVGFGVKVNCGGQRSYVLQYRIGGRSRRYTIGTHGSPWMPETSRERAKILLGQVAGGVDPQEEKAEDRKALALAELCDLYLTEGLATHKSLSVASANAAFLGHTVGTPQTYRWMGTGPRFRKIGRRIVYALGDLEA